MGAIEYKFDDGGLKKMNTGGVGAVIVESDDGMDDGGEGVEKGK